VPQPGSAPQEIGCAQREGTKAHRRRRTARLVARVSGVFRSLKAERRKDCATPRSEAWADAIGPWPRLRYPRKITKSSGVDPVIRKFRIAVLLPSRESKTDYCKAYSVGHTPGQGESRSPNDDRFLRKASPQESHGRSVSRHRRSATIAVSLRLNARNGRVARRARQRF
jgi:hypothetical protein